MNRRLFLKSFFCVICSYGAISFVLDFFSFLFGGRKKNSIGSGDLIVVVMDMDGAVRTYGGVVKDIGYDEYSDIIVMELGVMGNGKIETGSAQVRIGNDENIQYYICG